MNRAAFLLLVILPVIAVGARADERGDAEIVSQNRTFFDGAKPESKKTAVTAAESNAAFSQLKPSKSEAFLDEGLLRKRQEIGGKLAEINKQIGAVQKEETGNPKDLALIYGGMILIGAAVISQLYPVALIGAGAMGAGMFDSMQYTDQRVKLEHERDRLSAVHDWLGDPNNRK